MSDFITELRLNPGWRVRAAEWAEELDLEGVLTPQEIDVTWLRFVLQLDQREIAAVLARSQQLVSRLTRRALKKSRTILAMRLPPSARSAALPERMLPRSRSTPAATS